VGKKEKTKHKAGKKRARVRPRGGTGRGNPEKWYFQKKRLDVQRGRKKGTEEAKKEEMHLKTWENVPGTQEII